MVQKVCEVCLASFSVIPCRELTAKFCSRVCSDKSKVPENLAILSVSDHVWLHKQFGSATLWAYSREKVPLDSLVSWSQDQDRAMMLLNTNLLTQTKDNTMTAVAQQVQFNVVQELPETTRGTGGFGSTDK